MESLDIKEVSIQILLLIVAVWFVYTGYQANKKAKPFSLKTYKFSRDIDASFAAGLLVIGAGIILLLALKLVL